MVKKERRKRKKKITWDRWTDGPTDRWIDGRTRPFLEMGRQTHGPNRNERKRNRKRKIRGREKEKNKAGYTAQDAPSMLTFHLRK